MRRTITALLLCGSSLAFMSATAVRVVTKVPEGVPPTWPLSVLGLKPGYIFQRGSSNKFYSIANAGASKGTKTGTYQCDCDKGGGSCSAEQTSKSSMKCVAKNGCTACALTVEVGKDGKIEVQPVH